PAPGRLAHEPGRRPPRGGRQLTGRIVGRPHPAAALPRPATQPARRPRRGAASRPRDSPPRPDRGDPPAGPAPGPPPRDPGWPNPVPPARPRPQPPDPRRSTAGPRTDRHAWLARHPSVPGRREAPF